MQAPQIIMIVAFLAVVGFFAIRSIRGAKSGGLGGGSVQPGLDLLRASFAQDRAPNETEPVCVVAFHYSMTSYTQVTVGVTNLRILVVKGPGPMRSFPYDAEGEHLGSTEKTRQQRGFFEWSHGDFKDGSRGYSPTVKRHPPFEGEEWRMYPTLEGFPEQKANLREFSRLFYFQWFYD